MATFVRYLLASSIAVAASLSSTSARANHETYLYVSVLGHGTLMPGYASVLSYAIKGDKRMPVGWVVPNVVTSLLAASVGVTGLAASTHGPTIELYGENPNGIAASVTVLVGSVVVGLGTFIEATRPAAPSSRGPNPANETALLPVIVLPTASVTRERGTTFGLTASGVF